MLRCVGQNPLLKRTSEGKITLEQHLPALTKLQQRRLAAAHAWANAKDRDSSKRNSYFKDIVTKKPGGDFIHYLG
jgi:hypothetical protein